MISTTIIKFHRPHFTENHGPDGKLLFATIWMQHLPPCPTTLPEVPICTFPCRWGIFCSTFLVPASTEVFVWGPVGIEVLRVFCTPLSFTNWPSLLHAIKKKNKKNPTTSTGGTADPVKQIISARLCQASQKRCNCFFVHAGESIFFCVSNATFKAQSSPRTTVIGTSTGDSMASLFHRSICNCRTIVSLRRKKKSQEMWGKQRDQEGRSEKSMEQIWLQARTVLSAFERVSFNLALISICCRIRISFSPQWGLERKVF